MTRSGQGGGGNSVDQGIMPEKGGKGGWLSPIRSLGANDANLPCKSRHISRHRAVKGRSGEHGSPPFLACSPASRSLFSTMHHSADSPEVDEKFSELLSRELSRRAPATSRKFHDINAISLRAADRRMDFAYLRKQCSRASSEFIGHYLTNRCENLSTSEKFLSSTCSLLTILY